MKILFYQLTILSLMLFSSCKGENEQLECFDNSLRSEDLKPLLVELRNDLTDTLNNWIYQKEYERVQILSRVNWKVDEAIFISPEKDKAILLVLEQDTAKFTTVPSDIPYAPEILKPTSFDDIHLIYANKEQGSWHYYYQSMELLVVPRKMKNNGTPLPLTFEELSLTGKRNILLSYYKNGTCKYNDNFFERWDITNLKEQHKKINGYY